MRADYFFPRHVCIAVFFTKTYLDRQHFLHQTNQRLFIVAATHVELTLLMLSLKNWQLCNKSSTTSKSGKGIFFIFLLLSDERENKFDVIINVKLSEYFNVRISRRTTNDNNMLMLHVITHFLPSYTLLCMSQNA